MSMVSEFLVLGVIGSVVLGPRKMAKLSADAARLMQKFKAVQQDFTQHLQSELNPVLAAPTAPSVVEPGSPVHPVSHQDAPDSNKEHL